jgi:hypothetical protein
MLYSLFFRRTKKLPDDITRQSSSHEDIGKRFDIRRQISELTGIPYHTVCNHVAESPSMGHSQAIAVPKQVAGSMQELSVIARERGEACTFGTRT